jgi:hypothetical protein
MRYAPFYCEENVWHLSRDPALPPGRRFVVFISSTAQQTPLWRQKAGEADENGYVVWDYHVVLVVEGADGATVWDLDTTIGMPVPVEQYLRDTFLVPTTEPHAPLFRVIEAEEFTRVFSSDRSHMRAQGNAWRALPPPWPPLIDAQGTMNLASFVDMAEPFVGTVLELDQFRQRFA